MPAEVELKQKKDRKKVDGERKLGCEEDDE